MSLREYLRLLWVMVRPTPRPVPPVPDVPECAYSGGIFVPGRDFAEIAENVSHDRRFGGRGGYRMTDGEPELWV